MAADIETVTRTAVSIPLALWQIVLIFTTVYKLRKLDAQQANANATPAVIKPVLYSLLSHWSFALISWSINAAGLPIYGDRAELFSNPLNIMCCYIQWTTFIISYISAYLFMIFNLYYSFKGSVFDFTAEKKWVFYAHGLNGCLMVVLSLSAMILFYNANHIKIGYILLSINLVLMLLGAVNLVYLFLRSLFKLSVMQRETFMRMHSTLIGEEEKQRDIKLNQRQLTLIELITKISVLIHVNGFVVMICFGALVAVITNFEIEALKMVFWIIFAAECVLMALSLYMILSVNNTTYTFFCSKCHRLCQGLCRYAAKRAMRDAPPLEFAIENENTSNITEQPISV